jgi:hypothetical protein
MVVIAAVGTLLCSVASMSVQDTENRLYLYTGIASAQICVVLVARQIMVSLHQPRYIIAGLCFIPCVVAYIHDNVYDHDVSLYAILASLCALFAVGGDGLHSSYDEMSYVGRVASTNPAP